jgi:hypothetical protein
MITGWGGAVLGKPCPNPHFHPFFYAYGNTRRGIAFRRRLLTILA